MTTTTPPARARFSAIDTRVRAWRRVLIAHSQGEALMLALSALIGAGTGLLAAALIEVVHFTQKYAWGTDATALRILLVPTVGAFIVGLLITYWSPESGGSGILETMQTIALKGGRFHGRVPFASLLTSGISIGTGAAGGREGPIVLIGGSFGSVIGRFFGVDEDRLRTLVAAGAAAGIGASFNAPIGGMLFAIELIIGGFRVRSLQTIVVASVAGSVTARQVIGPEIIYRPLSQYRVNDPRELVLYALLGLAAVGVGLGFLYFEELSKRMFGKLTIWAPWRLALGGLSLGVLALVLPEVLGTGDKLPPIRGWREPIQRMLDGDVGVGFAAAGFLLLLAVAKIIATSLSVGSGNAVGTFAPVIFSGAALGGAVGLLAQQLLPNGGVQPGAFALVGMAAAFGAAARAPLTAIVIVFEITGDYELVLPLMLATGLATFLADRVAPESIYTMPLRRMGIVYAEPEDVDIMQTVSVGEVMTRVPDTVDANMPVAELKEFFTRSGHHGYPVVRDGDRLVGVVTRSDLARESEVVPMRGRLLTVGDICTTDPTVVVPRDPVYRALRRMAALDVGRLPVVAADDHKRLVGLIRRQDMVKAYQRAVTRSAVEQQREDTARVRDLVGVQFIELVVDAGAAVTQHPVSELTFPPSTVLTSVRRGGDVLVPRGDTQLRPGDEVVALTASGSAEPLRALFGAPTPKREKSSDTGPLPVDPDAPTA